MRTGPTAAMEVLLGLPPLHLQVKVEAKIGNYRLRCNKQWKPKSEGFGHAYKLPIVQLLKKFPAFYGTRWFTTVFTRALHWFLS
jgi:hypothetical protein